MNSINESLSEDQITDLIGFLKKINYPREDLIFEIKKKLIKPTPATEDIFNDTIKLEDLLRLGFQEIGFNWLIVQISSDIFKTYEKSISKGQIKAILKRVLKLPLTNIERTQLSKLRKKIRRSERLLTYFGEWGKEPDQTFKVIVIGLNDDQSDKLSHILTQPKISGERDTIGVDFYTKTMEFADKSLTKLQFWNISGEKRFESLREYYYKGGSAMIIVYEKGNQESIKLAKKYYSEFKKVTKLKFKIKKFKNIVIDTPLILVGLGNMPIISSQGGPFLATEFGAHYFDKSEINADQFEDVFVAISVELLVKSKYPVP